VRWPRRVTIASVLVLVVALAASGAASAAKSKKAPRVRINHACSMVDPAKLGKAFGTPVDAQPSPMSAETGCDVKVGVDPKQPPGGALSVNQEYPNFDMVSARSAVEDRHATEFLAHDELEDITGVGKYAYLNHTIGVIVVQASKKLAFSLLWQRAGVTGITKADAKKLVALAKDIVARSPH
jgi:hypothetical protein